MTIQEYNDICDLISEYGEKRANHILDIFVTHHNKDEDTSVNVYGKIIEMLSKEVIR